MTTLEERLEAIWGEEPGLGTWVSTVDHKRIAKKYLFTALAFFVFGGIESLQLEIRDAAPAGALP
ncbi:MAG TPA: hypothetical protein VFP19_08645 [Candidatus Limnocylindrales bacterium]|nr:hypothetical protein [Candidatus Limnocylindrales bacterium]